MTTASHLQDKAEASHGHISKQSTGTKRCYGSSPRHTKEPSATGSVSKKSTGTKPSYSSFSRHGEEPSSGPVSNKFTGTKSNKGPFPHNAEEPSSPRPISRCTRKVCEPSSPPRTAAPASPISESESLGEYKREVRGVARGETLEKHVKKYGKFKILFPPGRTVSMTNNKDLSSGIGLIMRNHADIERASGWKYVSNKQFCFARLLHWFDIEDIETRRVQRIISGKFQRAYTSWKNTLHTAYNSLKSSGRRPMIVTPRIDVTLPKWQFACDFIENPEYQERSNINKANRQKKLFNHTSGRIPLICRYEEMEKKSEFEHFKAAYVSKKRGDKFVNSAAESKYDEMVAAKQDLIEAGYTSSEISESLIVAETLGRKSGYVKGMGHGLDLVRGNTSNMVAGIDLKEKLSELDSANEKIAILTNMMSKMQKIIENLPGAPPDLFCDGTLDDIDEDQN